MTEINPPGFIQARSDHPASELRNTFSAFITGEGIVSAADFAVTQRGAGANMSVDIAGGQAFVKGDDNVNQGYYHVLSDATVTNKTITASHATLSRVDLVVARVYDAQYSGATNLWQFEVITGTPGSPGVAPALPNGCLLLATIAIAATVTSILTANITNNRALFTMYATVLNANLTGVPTAPTAAVGTNTTQIATTAFVLANAGDATADILMTMGG